MRRTSFMLGAGQFEAMHEHIAGLPAGADTNLSRFVREAIQEKLNREG